MKEPGEKSRLPSDREIIGMKKSPVISTAFLSLSLSLSIYLPISYHLFILIATCKRYALELKEKEIITAPPIVSVSILSYLLRNLPSSFLMKKPQTREREDCADPIRCDLDEIKLSTR